MPTPKPGESQDSFIGRCIPYVKKEHPDLEHDAVIARCYGIWRQSHKHKLLYTFDMYDDNALEWDVDRIILMSDKKDVYPSVCLIGNRFYKGNFLSSKEIEKAYLSMNGAYHDINHWGTSFPKGAFEEAPNIEYVVGYQDNTKFDNKLNKMTTDIHIVDSAPKAQVWKGFMDICRAAKKVPNVSVAFWADKRDISVKELPKDVDYRQYGYGENDIVTSLVDLEFHALSTVFKGACDDKTGCGIGITNNYSWFPIPTIENVLVVDQPDELELSIDNEKKKFILKEILKEKIKKEELFNGR